MSRITCLYRWRNGHSQILEDFWRNGYVTSMALLGISRCNSFDTSSPPVLVLRLAFDPKNCTSFVQQYFCKNKSLEMSEIRSLTVFNFIVPWDVRLRISTLCNFYFYLNINNNKTQANCRVWFFFVRRVVMFEIR